VSILFGWSVLTGFFWMIFLWEGEHLVLEPFLRAVPAPLGLIFSSFSLGFCYASGVFELVLCWILILRLPSRVLLGPDLVHLPLSPSLSLPCFKKFWLVHFVSLSSSCFLNHSGTGFWRWFYIGILGFLLGIYFWLGSLFLVWPQVLISSRAFCRVNGTGVLGIVFVPVQLDLLLMHGSLWAFEPVWLRFQVPGFLCPEGRGP
jgi:hypothetical protein